MKMNTHGTNFDFEGALTMNARQQKEFDRLEAEIEAMRKKIDKNESRMWEILAPTKDELEYSDEAMSQLHESYDYADYITEHIGERLDIILQALEEKEISHGS